MITIWRTIVAAAAVESTSFSKLNCSWKENLCNRKLQQDTERAKSIEQSFSLQLAIIGEAQ